jgi:hypothetical protein
MWGQIAAAVAPSIIGGLMGGGKGGASISKEAVARAGQIAPYATFRPYTVTTSMGQQGYNPMTGQQYSMMTPQYQDIVNKALAGAGGITGQLADFMPEERAAEIYKEQLSLLQPSFEKQATDLQSRLFGSGRLGLRLAGESQGLGAGSGMVQPDALGLGQAQQQTMAQVAAGARTQAFQEQQQLSQLATNMLQLGLGVNQAETQLIKLGVDAETARTAAQYAAGMLELSPYGVAAKSADTAATNRMGLFSGMTTGMLSNPGFFNQGSGGTTTTARSNPVGGYGYGVNV